MKLKLQIPVLRDGVARVTVNGQPTEWKLLADSVGLPRIEIEASPAVRQDVVVEWKGRAIDAQTSLNRTNVASGGEFSARFAGADELTVIRDPQGALSDLAVAGHGFTGRPPARPAGARCLRACGRGPSPGGSR